MRARRWILRLGSAALGLLLLALAEGALRWSERAGPGPPLAGTGPLFELSGGEFRTAAVRTSHFARVSFRAGKREGALRIFVLGGSTVQGRPWGPETAFPAWLELILARRLAPREVEVVNCGGVSYASYRLLPVLRECLERYRPDWIVLCTGHNEFLERQEVRRQDPYGLSSLRLYRLLRGRPRQEPLRRALPAEVDALLDHRGGLEAYRRDPAWRREVGRQFRRNLEAMARMCDEAGVPLVLVAPPANLRSCPPFKSVHREGLLPEERERWEELAAGARSLYGRDPLGAAALLERAIALDPLYAHAHFALGTMLESLGRGPEAREAFLRAKELDVCPLRMLESERETLAGVARRARLPLIDAQALLEAESPFGILGSDLLVDHVHPSIRGHQAVAEALAAVLAPGPPPEREDLAGLYARRMESLGPLYFAHGRLRLENLRLWTEGRAGGLPPEDASRQEGGPPAAR